MGSDLGEYPHTPSRTTIRRAKGDNSFAPFNSRTQFRHMYRPMSAGMSSGTKRKTSDSDGEDAANPAAVPDAPSPTALPAAVCAAQPASQPVDQGQQPDPNGSDHMMQNFGRTTQQLIMMLYAAQHTRLVQCARDEREGIDRKPDADCCPGVGDVHLDRAARRMHAFSIAHRVSKENPINVAVYHGPRRYSIIFADYDVVVTSYSTLAADFSASGNR
ncbi:hypothetical protein BZA05DRAFT_416225 [Tricharina praecox]|uniref:uncharacterized protein n=1 Tax=Tricharina praecox TaxID=43433 RepID=UPI00221F2119|nr:uncharacterized protein BZA05DRAFT_416225 [Tricharina praecox]KAI5856570.1 hypothetical protein BZA05DRAFT_416225 [Tricharina praecox]